ncbi:hypothetical protein NY546_13925 [Curtobacterium flaccumfaciens pv. flaccumfaciens]|uniref:hypothetical protein n=1 Tax=Curtobacterium TaxID=2034 RepID=UPI0008DEA236|nr:MULTISPECIES: hypothetical protein [Curtobacterium]MCS5510397.1 hypothetical protein [Curtobacterium flaccumfaciens pv. flaccumfaciens]MCX2785060.1 hypothetical protein [Curtobacterium flaccumfaciens pv. flaccumfaciens]NQX23784.1 hypothetical protein [Curtobacterium sp. VKM Ac-2852]OII07977.1 hypothetical protein BIU89_07835 [Curtobacterium sp. MCBA15_005]QKS87502.1 hypothetical protein FK523_08120 [Curtobacterium flaccumfaciens pv. flaccumfaciens]
MTTTLPNDLEMVTYTIPADHIVLPDLVQFFSELDSPELVWVLTTLYAVTSPDKPVQALPLERRVDAAAEPGLILSHAEAMEIADSMRQLIDGEFLGYLPGSDLTDESNLVVRIDAFDSGEWTVTVRPPLTTMSDAFDRTHGPAQLGRPATRLEEFGPRQQTTNGTNAGPPAS